MVCIANYDENQAVTGCTREDGASGGLEFLKQCEDLGMTITYKTQQVLDIEKLAKAKLDKIALIDKTTGEAIEALVGDNNKQKDKLAEMGMLLEAKFDLVATPTELARLAELKDLNIQVGNLKYNGRNREATVALVEITTTLEAALLEVENI